MDSEWTESGIIREKISSSQGRVLENLMEVGEDSAYYCNLQENMRGNNGGDAKDYRVLLCKDPVYDITYYVNYGRDYYIYALRGETYEASLYELYLNGEIVFTIEADIYEGYHEVFSDISRLEKYIAETERKLKMYLNE